VTARAVTAFPDGSAQTTRNAQHQSCFADDKDEGEVMETDKGDTEATDEQLDTMSKFRQQHRRTLDGRLCAAAYEYKGKEFTSCTRTETPGPGHEIGRAWCMVDNALIDATTAPNWGYCGNVTDYDRLRRRVADNPALAIIER
jgi:hypothetical protein